MLMENLLGSLPISREMFHGDSFSPLLFVVLLLPMCYMNGISNRK